jgi:hypothetical protein
VLHDAGYEYNSVTQVLDYSQIDGQITTEVSGHAGMPIVSALYYGYHDASWVFHMNTGQDFHYLLVKGTSIYQSGEWVFWNDPLPVGYGDVWVGPMASFDESTYTMRKPPEIASSATDRFDIKKSAGA